jgi:hypothetical protein
LGDAYGEPVYLGSEQNNTPVTANEGQDLVPGKVDSTVANKSISTQAYMSKVASMWASDPATYRALQAQLAQAGFYGSTGTYSPGQFGPKDISAFTDMLSKYEVAAGATGGQLPMTVSEYLSMNAQASPEVDKNGNPVGGSSTAAPPPPPTYHTTDPATIRAAAEQAFQTATGKGPSKKQLHKFVKLFQNAQLSAEKQVGGNASAPDLSSDAMAYAQSADPQAYANQQANAYMNMLLNMFLPSESQRPNTPLVMPATADMASSPYPSQGNRSADTAGAESGGTPQAQSATGSTGSDATPPSPSPDMSQPPPYVPPVDPSDQEEPKSPNQNVPPTAAPTTVGGGDVYAV